MTEQELIQKYPKIFKMYEGNPCGVNWSLPKGWITLVDNLCSYLQFHKDNNNHLEEYGHQIECTQMKEKYGSLRFYVNGSTHIQGGAIGLTESMSYKTCMNCGSTEDVTQTEGWVETLCNKCLNKK